MKLTSLEQLFQFELKDLYSAETQLVKALPKLAKAATDKDLKDRFAKDLEETKGHVLRLKRIAQDLGVMLSGHWCYAMEGLIKGEGEMITEDADGAVRDAGLIGAAQGIEHFEIAAYGTAQCFAETLGHDEAAKLLGETLAEEKAGNEMLTGLAKTRINAEACGV